MTNYKDALTIAAMAVWLAAPLAAQKPDPAQAALKAAIDKEMVDGDLKGAIALYEKTVAESGSERATAAKALLRMAECYQKMGDNEAAKVYERLLRDFSDQKDAVAVARTRMGGTRNAAAKGDRPVWTGPKVDIFGRISPDGRYFTYVDWGPTNELAVHDMATGRDRLLTKKKSSAEWGSFSAFSRDGKHLAYAWGTAPLTTELRVAPFTAGSIGASRLVMPKGEYTGVRPYDWSPDDQWIALAIQRKDRSGQVGLVRVQDGTLRVLKSTDWREPSNMAFSPDGKYLAFDIPAGEDTSQRDVWLLAVDGSSGSAITSHPANDRLVGFSANGQQLFFASDRTGSNALWAQAIGNGKAHGAPVNVRADFGTPWIHGITRSGALYVTKEVSDRDVYVAPLNPTEGKLAGPAAGLQAFPTLGRPSWSPSGKQLAYVDCGPFNSGPCSQHIWTPATGRNQRLNPALHYIFISRWSPDESKLLVAASNLKGRRGAYVVDIATSEVTPVGEVGQDGVIGFTEDGRGVRLGRRDARGAEVLVRDLATGKEVETGRLPVRPARAPLSNDGRAYVHIVNDAAAKSSSLVMAPLAGGTSRELLRVQQPEFLVENSIYWTLHGRALIVTRQRGPERPDGTADRELWWVPVDGGSPRKLDIDITAWETTFGNMSVSQDGRNLAFLSGKRGFEVWVMEGLAGEKGLKP